MTDEILKESMTLQRHHKENNVASNYELYTNYRGNHEDSHALERVSMTRPTWSLSTEECYRAWIWQEFEYVRRTLANNIFEKRLQSGKRADKSDSRDAGRYVGRSWSEVARGGSPEHD